eukprot:CAMPEP_0115066476 /NCGR_PEP_ID=MMETSP0227-20121206/10827_1 /TAXON_ID=89957 /ORGANISM="Polarella glacialis, Strain CCMP 1383" /LENGTH=343 /DNA_ID=CAMNT_0002452379 /DNA_START=86 /DNA_END=1117 /DNA_ORIENTATION=-
MGCGASAEGAYLKAAPNGVAGGDCQASARGTPVMFDGHIHLWPDADWVPGAVPQKGLEMAATFAEFHEKATRAGVVGALVVTHNFKWVKCDAKDGTDHSYLCEAIQAFPNFFRGIGMVSPLVGVDSVESVLQRFCDLGFVGVRINLRDHWERDGQGPMADVARATFAIAGKLGMVVGLYGMVYDAVHLSAMHELLALAPGTTVVIDHFGCFREAGKSDDAHEHAFLSLLDFAKYPKVHMKVSGWKRVSSVLGGARMSLRTDVVRCVERVVAAFTSKRTLWGSDAPLALLDGGMPPGHAAYQATIGTTYDEVCCDTDILLTASTLSAEERADLYYGTAKSLFRM